MIVGTTDWIGLATFVTAFGAVVTGLLVAFWQRPIRKQVDEVHAAVATPPDAPPLGQVVADVHDTVDEVKKTLNGGTH